MALQLPLEKCERLATRPSSKGLMTVLLVLFTFVTFLLIDYFHTQNAAVGPALNVSAAKHEGAPRLQHALVGRLHEVKAPAQSKSLPRVPMGLRSTKGNENRRIPDVGCRSGTVKAVFALDELRPSLS